MTSHAPGGPPPVRIGSLVLDNPFLLGGLAGYGDPFFRRACLRAAAAAVVTPMILDKTLLAARAGRVPRVPLEAEDHPVIGQLIGADPATMAAAARVLQNEGYDAVDVNLACPAPKVLRRGRGGRLLENPGKALAVLRAVRDAVTLPVTAKLRGGFDASATSRSRLFEILEGLPALPVDGVTFHPRTVEDRFRGRADRNLLREVRARLQGVFVAGSGDLMEAEDGVSMLRETGVDAVTFARGAVGNPWIFAQALALLRGGKPPAPALDERAAFFRDYARQVVSAHGERRGLLMVRKTGVKMARFTLHAKRLRVRFANAATLAELEALLDDMAAES